MKTACVLGGAGFLGSHVADCLSEAGYAVRVFDRDPSPWLRGDQQMVLGDITDESSVRETFEGCDVVYNFAAVADLNEAITKPIDTARINVLGNTIALHCASIAGVQRFVYASTVYVQSREGGFYRSSKKAAEDYTEEFYRSRGLNYTILRFGSLYGPRSDQSNGLLRIVRGAVESGQVSYEGSPEAIREFIHVVDAARAAVKVLSEEFRNAHVVVTGMQSMKVLDMLEMLREIMGLSSPVLFNEVAVGGHYIRTPYAHVPVPALKYVPSSHVDLGQGLMELVDIVTAQGST